MGMFDTLMIPCAHCGHVIEEQTKDGDCTLAYYTPETAPQEMMCRFVDRPISCDSCGKDSVIRGHQTVIYRVHPFKLPSSVLDDCHALLDRLSVDRKNSGGHLSLYDRIVELSEKKR